MNSLIRIITSMKMTIIGMLMIGALVIYGTFFQVAHGVFKAQVEIFSAWYFTIGIIPLPAMKSLLLLLSINLLASGFKKTILKPSKLGIFLAHLGTAVLFMGVGFTSHLITESQLVLKKSEPVSEALCHDFRALTLTVVDLQKGDTLSNITRTLKHVKSGTCVAFPEAKTDLRVVKYYQNARVFGDATHGIDSIALQEDDPGTQQDQPAITVRLSRSKPHQTKDTLIHIISTEPVFVISGTEILFFSMHPARIPLPFKVELSNFEIETYPGTTKAKSYRSTLKVTRGDQSKTVKISMNRPFRHGSLTFYQTGYAENSNIMSSRITIMDNPFRSVPYIACIIIITGLLFHFGASFLKSMSRKAP